MSTELQTKVQASPAQNFTPVQTGLLQRKCTLCNTPGLVEDSERDKEKLILQRSPVDQAETTTVPPIVHEVLRSPGQPLDPATRAYMEPRFGHDFSRVSVHTDAKAAESARAVNALAYTVGQHIVFGAGRYSPQIGHGRKLLAHELVHTIQQNADTNKVASSNRIPISKPNDVSEKEAEVASTVGVSSQHQLKPFKVQHQLGNTTIQRAIRIPRIEDSTSREARRQISLAREALRDSRLTSEARSSVQSRIREAETALRAYRRTVGSSSTGPMFATTTTGPSAIIAVVALGIMAFGTWIIGTSAIRNPANSEATQELGRALTRLGEALTRAQPLPAPQEVPVPEEVTEPRPPGEVIPIESHPRYQPHFQEPIPEPPVSRPLGPDIFILPRPEPRRPRPRRRNECFEQNPTFIPCDGFWNIYEAAAYFLQVQNEIDVEFDALRECHGRTSFVPNVIEACDHGPGENWHCQVEGAFTPLSIFGCLCCEEDGTAGHVWRGAHWSRGR